MIDPPPRLGRFKWFPALGDWLNHLRDYAVSLKPRQSFGTVTEHTSEGVFRKTKPGEETTGTAGPYWLP